MGAAAAWLELSGPSADLDDGRAALATSGEVFVRQPEVSVRWATQIVDPELRATTLLSVVGEWPRRDSAAARRFVQASPWLQPAERSMLLDDPAVEGGP